MPTTLPRPAQTRLRRIAPAEAVHTLVPRAAGVPGDASEWIAVFEALAMSGIAFVQTGSMRKSGSRAVPS